VGALVLGATRLWLNALPKNTATGQSMPGIKALLGEELNGVSVQMHSASLLRNILRAFWAASSRGSPFRSSQGVTHVRGVPYLQPRRRSERKPLTQPVGKRRFSCPRISHCGFLASSMEVGARILNPQAHGNPHHLASALGTRKAIFAH
jgi:hypothetical protein